MKFRDLRADEIDVRIGLISKEGKGLSLLLYKDARCDMNILDETVGSENWEREHYECKGNLYCKVGINRNYKDVSLPPIFVCKSDCGAESNTEKEKGEASDSFKRACFNWGIGRELYTSPFIWVNATDCNIKNNKCNDKFSVKSIKIKDKKIVDLEIYNNTLKRVVYKMNGKPPKQDTPKNQQAVICPVCGKQMKEMTTAKGTVWKPEQILKQYGMCCDCWKSQQQGNTQ